MVRFMFTGLAWFHLMSGFGSVSKNFLVLHPGPALGAVTSCAASPT